MRNRPSNRFIPLVAFVILAISLASSASSLTISPGASGLDGAIGCTTPSSLCLATTSPPFNATFLLPPPPFPPVTGSIDLVGSTLSFSIDLAGPATLVGVDGAVTSVTFTNVNYSGSVSVVPTVGGVAFTDQATSISGTLTPNGAGSPVAFNIANVNTTGNCFSGSSLVCGLQFGAGSRFGIDVNGNQRYFLHTLDVNAVIPEPGTALLVGFGLSALAVRRRPFGDRR